jgi:hypothetical protein
MPSTEFVLTPMAKRMRTQWTAQFLVASELARRGYTVSFTMGNHTPDADLMVGIPGGGLFWIDVKGLSAKNSWVVSNKKTNSNLYYVLVYVAPEPPLEKSRDIDQFFVLTQEGIKNLLDDYLKRHPNDKNKLPGFGWSDPKEFRNAWHKLPPSHL